MTERHVGSGVRSEPPDEQEEGVVRFEAAHRRGELPAEALERTLELAGWRSLLRRLGLLGQEPGRYGGFGFGNLSVRCGEGFLVTGSQTSGLPELGADGYALVERWDEAANRVTSSGPGAGPSSESLTHGAVYAAVPDAAAVFHVHAPELWSAAPALGLPATDAAAEAGSAAMAAAVRELVQSGVAGSPAVVRMAGHEDGMLAWGRSPWEAGEALLAALARVRKLSGTG